MKKVFLVALFFISMSSFCQEKFDVSAVENFQKKLNFEFADKEESPLTEEDRAVFKTLEYFPISVKYFVIAQFTRTESEKTFEMKTTKERRPIYVKYGELAFTIDGKPLKLNLYKNIELSKKEEFKDYLFLPFSDNTNGKESYIGGRYIDMKVPKGDTVAIDFNTAYNPYCAYNYKYSCPIVPLENVLDIEINAGVKKFHN
jgi:uncharacterized protein (DUF1684 family)